MVLPLIESGENPLNEISSTFPICISYDMRSKQHKLHFDLDPFNYTRYVKFSNFLEN